MLQGLSAEQVCRRELAGLWALGIASTSAAAGSPTFDASAAAPGAGGAAAAKPWEAQGFQVAKDARCALAAGAAARTAAVAARCDGGAPPAAAGAAEALRDGTAAFNAADGLCAQGTAACDGTAGAYAPRGPALLAGVEDYYWFARLAQGADLTAPAGTPQASALAEPAQLEGGYAYWLSGLYKWMVPANGKPAPHNIMTGQWRASDALAAEGVPVGGFGAVVKLAVPEACGAGAAQGPARQLAGAWAAMQKEFKLDAATERKEPVPAGTVAAWDDATTAERKPVSAEDQRRLLGDGPSDCAASDQREFPAKGEWAELPVYLAPSYVDAAGETVGAGSGRCYAQRSPTAWVAYEPDAYRACAWANKWDEQAAAAAVTAAKAVAEAATLAAGTAAEAGKLDAECLAAAGVDATTGRADPATVPGATDATATPAAALLAWRACPANAACEALAVTTTALDRQALAACPARAACSKAAGRDAKAAAACLELSAAQANTA